MLGEEKTPHHQDDRQRAEKGEDWASGLDTPLRSHWEGQLVPFTAVTRDVLGSHH